jgi:hypothetical protein
MASNLFSPHIAESSVHDFFSDAKFEIRIREVILPEDVVYKYGTPLTTTDGINYEMSGTEIKCLLANTIDTTGMTDPKSREVAAYFTGGFNQNKVEDALGSALDPVDVAKAREIQIDIYPWQKAPVPISF